MKIPAFLTLSLSIAAQICHAFPSVDNLVVKDVKSPAALRTVYTADSADKVFGDFLMRANGTFLANSPTSNQVLVIDPDQGVELSSITIPGVNGTFGIANLGFYPTEGYFLVGGNLTDRGAPVKGSFSIFEITMSTPGDGFYDTQVNHIASFPASTISPTGSLAHFSDYAYIADVGASRILTYELSTSTFASNPFESSPLLANPHKCPIQIGVDGLAIGQNFVLWFSNQVQALTGSVQLTYMGAPAGDFKQNAQQVQTEGSDVDCVFLSWGKFALGQDDAQWIATSAGTVVKAETDGQYGTVVTGLRGPKAVAFGVTEETKRNLYVVTRASETVGSSIQVFDTTRF